MPFAGQIIILSFSTIFPAFFHDKQEKRRRSFLYKIKKKIKFWRKVDQQVGVNQGLSAPKHC